MMRRLFLALFLFVPALAAQSGRLTVTGSLRLRGELWDWFEADTGGNTYAYSGNLFRLGLSQSRPGWDWTAEFAVPFLFGLPDDAIAAGAQGQLGLGASYFAANNRKRNAAMVFPKQLFIRVKNLGGSPAHSLRIGRFEFFDGSETAPKNPTLAALKRDRVNQRLLGGFGFSHVGRSFDGAQYTYSKPSGAITVLAATPTRGAFQVDGWGWNRAAFGYVSYTRSRATADTRVFVLTYSDWRDVLKTDNRPTALRRADTDSIRIETFGGHSVHAAETTAGTIDALAWGALQTGRWGVQDHRAHAVDVEAGIQPKLLKALKPWLRAGFYDGSGDGNPADGRHGTFFQVLPTPRLFARFPFFNMMNNRDRFAMLILRPYPKVTASTEFHALRLGDGNDLWYSGAGIFQPWTFGYAGRAAGGRRSLANLYDASLEYRASGHATITAYAGYAQGRAATALIYPRGKNGAFGYLELFYRF